MTDRLFHVRVSVLEIYNEAIRDLLSENAMKTEIADVQDDYTISCTETSFGSLEEFKSVGVSCDWEADRFRRSGASQLAPRHGVRVHIKPDADHPCVLRQSSLRRVALPSERRNPERGTKLCDSSRNGDAAAGTDHSSPLRSYDAAVPRPNKFLPRSDDISAMSRVERGGELAICEADALSASGAGERFAYSMCGDGVRSALAGGGAASGSPGAAGDGAAASEPGGGGGGVARARAGAGGGAVCGAGDAGAGCAGIGGSEGGARGAGEEE